MYKFKYRYTKCEYGISKYLSLKLLKRSLMNIMIGGCYSSKFLRSSARRFHLEMLVRGTRYEVARARLVNPLTMVKYHDSMIVHV